MEMQEATFENFCIEDKELKLNDGAKKIFFNAKDYINAEDEEIREFLKYVSCYNKINYLNATATCHINCAIVYL